MLHPLLRKDRILLHLESQDRDAAIAELLGAVSVGNHRPAWFEEALARLIAREECGTTALGDGLAIPHCTLDGETGESFAVFGHSPRGIDFPSLDGRPVRFVFLTVFFEDSAEFRAKDMILRGAGSFFRDVFIQDQIRFASSTDAVYDLLRREAEGRLPDHPVGAAVRPRIRRTAQYAFS